MKNLQMRHFQKTFFTVLITLFFTVSAFAYDNYELDITIPEYQPIASYAATVPSEEGSVRISNNEFYLESLRLAQLAIETFEIGEYEASAGFALEAIYFAQLSDEYVAEQLIAEAKRLLDWADANNIATRHPIDYTDSKNYYEISVTAQSNEAWDLASNAAINTIEILASLQSGTTPPPRPSEIQPQQPPLPSGVSPLPAQYTVRTWASVRDCLWNIAGYSFVYNDPWRWRDLYEANRDKLPNPNNPDLIQPGTVINIPSIRGEHREGMWDPNNTYRP
ncbi:MAG: LysM peptidoglycan-binding domain-containing protein [Treponema sp.]|nr:LysM peptidoglycan-binding domain-containing protein [Treponema sp.]